MSNCICFTQSRKSFNPSFQGSDSFLPLETSLIICNIMGELILEKNIDSDFYHVDLKKQPPGVSIINIGNSKSYKFIKL